MADRLRGKVALITGAGMGMGREAAVLFAEEGARVIVADIDEAAARETVARVEKRGGQALAVVGDVAIEADVARMIAEGVARFGGLHVLHNNAGVLWKDRDRSVLETDERWWDRVMAINLKSVFWVTKHGIPHLRRAGGGSIILMGSVHSKEASPQKGPYVAAKHGLAGLCRVVAKEGAAHGIRSNLICPGFVRTPLVEKQIPQLAKELNISPESVVKDVMLKNTVDGEFATVNDVAQVALFLAAFPTNALTGQSITVSHGWHMA